MCEGQDKNEINSQKRGFYIAGRYIGLSVSGRVQELALWYMAKIKLK